MKNIEDLSKEYKKYCDDNDDRASNEVRDTMRAYKGALDDCLNAVIEDSWECGFRHAMRMMSGGGAR